LSESPREEVINDIVVRRVWYLMPTTAISLEPRTILRFFVSLILFPFVFLFTSYRLLRITRKEKPDIVNVHYLGRNAIYALALRLFFPFKLVLNVCGYDLDRYGESSRITKFYIKAVLRFADRVLANTDSQLHLAEAICPGVGRKAGVVGRGIYPEEFDNAVPYPHPRPYILAISNFHHRKGVDVLLSAFAVVSQKRRDLDLILVGEGEERAALEAQAIELGIDNNITFFGLASRDQVGAMLKGCQFLVLPSRSESFGKVLIEAMLVGKTVVASRVGGVPEVLRGGERGLLVEPESPAALASGILRLLEDPELQQRLTEGLSEKVRKEFPWSAVADRYFTHYQAVLGRER
jgi:glycosyltransferase involved in cell wall biosynthesis